MSGPFLNIAGCAEVIEVKLLSQGWKELAGGRGRPPTFRSKVKRSNPTASLLLKLFGGSRRTWTWSARASVSNAFLNAGFRFVSGLKDSVNVSLFALTLADFFYVVLTLVRNAYCVVEANEVSKVVSLTLRMSNYLMSSNLHGDPPKKNPDPTLSWILTVVLFCSS